jgi:hypothetical protein
MIEYTSNYYTLLEAWQHLASRFKRKPKPVEPEVLTPVQPTWLPTRDIERAVYAALILAGEPVNNRRLAELMQCSPAHASRSVAQLEGLIKKQRQGREVLLSLPSH